MNDPNKSKTEMQEKMKKPSTYEVDGRRFIVTPVINENGHESFLELLSPSCFALAALLLGNERL